MKKVLLGITSLSLAFMLTACSDKEEVDEKNKQNEETTTTEHVETGLDLNNDLNEQSEEVKQAFETILKNAEATNNEDVEGYINTLAEGSYPENIEEILQTTFDNINKHYEVKFVGVTAQTEEFIIIRVKQIVTDLDTNETVTEVYDHKLVLEDEEYKLSESTVPVEQTIETDDNENTEVNEE